MDKPVTDQRDGISDYGSEFSADEEEILNTLLHQTSDHGDISNRGPDLLLNDIEDEESPRGAKILRRREQKISGYPLLPLSESVVETQLDRDDNPSAYSSFLAT